MTASALLADLRALGVSLTVDGGRLRYAGPGDVIRSRLDDLRTHRDALVDLLADRDAPGPEPPAEPAAARPSPPVQAEPAGRRRPAEDEAAVETEVARIEPQALALGWRPEELRGDFWQIGPDGVNRPSLASCMRPGWRVTLLDAYGARIEAGPHRMTFRRSPL